MLTGAVVFAVTYVLVSARRLGWLGLDRPAAALLGAVGCVALGVLGPAEAIAAVDGRTLLLLFGMMGMGAFLGVDGFFERAGAALAFRARSPARLLGMVVWGAGALAPLVTNDAVCVLGAPLVVGLVRRHRLPPLPFLLALATAANTGSVATLVGNPQNMLCASLGGLEYREHLLLVGPVAVLGLALNHALLVLLFRRQLRGVIDAPRPEGPVLGRVSALALAVVGGTAALYVAGADLAWTAAGGFVALLLALGPGAGKARGRVRAAELWPLVDWSVLIFFAGLFVVVEGLVRSGVPALAFERVPLAGGEGLGGWLRVSGLFLLGSNVVSNVPYILVVREQIATLGDPRLGWELLTVASTFAGNMTLLGSVANIIVAEKGRQVGGMGFWQYLRVGLPLSLATTALGTVWLVLAWR